MKKSLSVILSILVFAISLINANVANAQAPVKKPQIPETVQDSDTPQSVEQKQVVTDMVAGHKFVDLGLTSGTKWSECNLGANSPDACGDYFAWGETSPNTTGSKVSSKWVDVPCSSLQSQGVIDSKKNLTSQHDAATAIWGPKWHMPAAEEIEELVKSCTWVWTNENGTEGYKVTGPNGNSIFLPAAGCRCGDKVLYINVSGSYWSSTAENDSKCAYDLYFHSSYFNLAGSHRSEYKTIRPVTK